MPSYLKSELAQAAGVSPRTLNRWLRPHAQHLASLGVTPRTHLLPPQAVEWICQYFCIDPDG